ncbi:MAG: hypothetical protein KF878_00245 [Planctomycetes bacterium]|nr:hypothetical protein [Planctomycetota bacterium]
MLRIYGASDDCIEIEGDVDAELYADRDGKAVLLVGDERLGLVVTVRYAPRDAAVWQVGVEPVDEGVPAWPARVEVQGYTAVVVVDCPPGTPVRKRHPVDGWVRLDADEEDAA